MDSIWMDVFLIMICVLLTMIGYRFENRLDKIIKLLEKKK